MKSRLAATALVTISASALALGACTTDGGTTAPGGKAAGDGKRAARKAGYERVGLRRGDAKDPGHDAPGDNAHGGRRKGDHGQVRVSAKVHHARDGVRDGS